MHVCSLLYCILRKHEQIDKTWANEESQIKQTDNIHKFVNTLHNALWKQKHWYIKSIWDMVINMLVISKRAMLGIWFWIQKLTTLADLSTSQIADLSKTHQLCWVCRSLPFIDLVGHLVASNILYTCFCQCLAALYPVYYFQSVWEHSHLTPPRK